MSRSFYKEDWEQHIKQKADQYKMYPSERVWKAIYYSLHPWKKWYWFGFVLLLSGVSYYSINVLISTPIKSPLATKTTIGQEGKKITQPSEFIPFKSVTTNNKKSEVTGSLLKPADLAVNDLVDGTNPNAPTEHSIQQGSAAANKVNTEIAATDKNGSEVSIPMGSLPDNIGPDHHNNIESRVAEEKVQKVNWLQEYALYELIAPKTKRTIWQLTFSPTMNYRKLTGSRNANIESDIKNIPIALNIEGDLDRLVNHKPALGFEMASSLMYAFTKNLTLKAGVQFNYSRYTIQAYSSYSSERATIALSNVSGNNLDSITSYTRIRNFGGDEVKDIQNQYFQLSAPIGLEWRLLGNERLQLKVAGTVQPTYLANRNTYLITTDYKNYTKEPSLVRRWNVNAAAEAFISYKAGCVKWQIGPQFRYQMFSSYVSKYPIQEYLMEYGVKFGVSKTIR